MNQGQIPQVVLYQPISTNGAIVCGLGFAAIVLIVWLVCRHKHRSKELDNEAAKIASGK